MQISNPDRTRTLRNGSLMLATLLMGACGQKPTSVSALAVTSFSPGTTPAGTPFNVQLDGNSGIWFKLNQPAPPGEFQAWFDSKPLNGVVANKTIVTATIPGDYLAQPGRYAIELEVVGRRLPAGTFVVEPR